MGRFINGLLLGAGIGLLLAPEKGEDIRANLAEAGGRWRDQLNKLLGRGGARLDDLRNFLDSQIEGMNDDAKGKISAILNELGPDDRQQGGGRGEEVGATQGQRQPASNGKQQVAGQREGQQQGQRQEASAQQGQGKRQDARAGQQQEGQQEGREA